jgi:hypothetical protein
VTRRLDFFELTINEHYLGQTERGQLFICTHKWAGSRSFVFTEQLQHEWDRR